MSYQEMMKWKKSVLQEELADIEEVNLQIEEKLKPLASAAEVEKYKSHNKDIENTPGTAGGPGGRDRTLAVKSKKNVRKITFFS